jgi:spermidine/putrescine transport system substrate-binding protein
MTKRRRRALRWTAPLLAMLAVLAVVAGTAAARTSQETLKISNWDLYMPEDVIPKFEKATGIKVKYSKHATNEDIMGKLEAANGGGFDLVFVSGPFAEALKKRGWAAKIDKKQIPNLKNLYPASTQLGYDPGNQNSVPYTWGTTGLCYRSDLVQGTPKSWNDILRPADYLKGKLTMLATDRWLMLPALRVLGYSINTTNQKQLEKARDLLKEAKENLLAYDDTTFYSRLVSGEASMVVAWDGWCSLGIAENPKIKFVVPKEGSDVWADTMVILEKSENKEAAAKFINFILRPNIHQAVSEYTLYKVPNEGAMAKVRKKLGKQFPNIAIPPKQLLQYESERDLGKAAPLWSRIVAEVRG